MTAIHLTTKKSPKAEKEAITYVDCVPKLSEAQYLDIFDMNMVCLRKEFGPGWTKTKKIGGAYADDSLRRAIDARYGFIKHWYELLEADLYILDHIARVRGYERAHLPGVVTSLVINIPGWHLGLMIYFRGKPLQAIPKDDLKAEVERLVEKMKGETKPLTANIEDLKKEIEYYLRGQGYDTLDIEETITIEA